MASKKIEPQEKDISLEGIGSKVLQNSSTDDAKMLAANALSAVRDATATISGRGKVEVPILSLLCFIFSYTLLVMIYLGIFFSIVMRLIELIVLMDYLSMTFGQLFG